jgi:hypothetical protein
LEKSADGRYELEKTHPHSDHFMAPDVQWRLIDTVSNRAVVTFSADTSDREVQSVQFDATGRVLVAKDGYGKVLERIDLVELAAAADDRREKRANRKARTDP